MKNKEITDEIHQISKTAANELPEQRNIDIPEGYFDETVESLIAQMKISQHTKTPEYQIPEGYFKSNENKWISQNNKPLLLINHWKQIAAVAVLLLFCWFLFRNETSYQNEDMDIALMYLNDNVYRMETDELIDYQLIQEEDLSMLEQEYEYEFLDFDSLESELEL
jgi:hypothetical protein